MISYVDDFALTVAPLSYRGNIRRLQELFERLEKKASRLGVSFSVAKTELIHWRTPSQRHSPKCLSRSQIKGEVFHPSNSVRWLGYWFTPALDPLHITRDAWPLPREHWPSYDASVRPARASPPTYITGWRHPWLPSFYFTAWICSHQAWAQQPASILSGARDKGGPQTLSQLRPPGYLRWSHAFHLVLS